MREIPHDEVTIISTEASEPLAIEVAKEMGVSFASFTDPKSEKPRRGKFANGEIFHKMQADKIQQHHVIIIGATHNDNSYCELQDLIDGAWQYHADSRSVIIPYFGYCTMEKAKPDSGEIEKGLHRVRRIYNQMQQPDDFVGFIDLHADVIAHAHDGHITTHHLRTDDFVAEKIREWRIPGDELVIASPDAGRSKWADDLAAKVGAASDFVRKSRFGINRVKVVGGLSPEIVGGKIVLMSDDIIRTAGSFKQAVENAMSAGAKEVIGHASHLDLTPETRENLQASGVKKVYGLDTYPGTQSDDLFTIWSVAPLIARTLKNRLRIAD